MPVRLHRAFLENQRVHVAMRVLFWSSCAREEPEEMMILSLAGCCISNMKLNAGAGGCQCHRVFWCRARVGFSSGLVWIER